MVFAKKWLEFINIAQQMGLIVQDDRQSPNYGHFYESHLYGFMWMPLEEEKKEGQTLWELVQLAAVVTLKHDERYQVGGIHDYFLRSIAHEKDLKSIIDAKEGIVSWQRPGKELPENHITTMDYLKNLGYEVDKLKHKSYVQKIDKEFPQVNLP